ncbi:MAG: glycosyltransferase [Elusimicrobiota bacterium]
MPKVAILIPSYDSQLHVDIVYRLVELSRNGYEIINVNGYANIIEARNNCIYRMMTREKESNTRYDYFMFIDSDIVFDTRYIDKMLAQDKSVVTGLYFTKNGGHKPLAGYWGSMNETGQLMYLSKKEVLSKMLVEIDWCGLGFTMFKRDVLDNIQYPWVEAKIIELKQPVNTGVFTLSQEILSEDLSFIKKMGDNGVKLYCDTELFCEHIGIQYFGLKQYLENN